MSQEELHIIFGVEKDPDDERDYKVATYLKKAQIELSESSIDWSNSMTPVKNQGRLGSCVAFSVCAVKEAQEKKEHASETGNKKEYDLSEQWLYYKCKEIDCWPKSQGTCFRYAMKVISDHGIPVEQGWSYNPEKKGHPEKWAEDIAKWYKCGTYWRIKTLEELKTLVAAKGPQVIGIICFDEIFKPDAKGVVAMPRKRKNVRGGHAICVVGFSNEKQLIKFKNSWGTNWGQDGYGYISYAYYNAYCLDAWYFADSSIQIVNPRQSFIAPKSSEVAMKVKLINKQKQVQIVHINKNGKDSTIHMLSKSMVTIKPEEMSEDIRMRIKKGLIEKL